MTILLPFLIRAKQVGLNLRLEQQHTQKHTFMRLNPTRAGVENSQHHLLTAEEGRQMLIRFCLKRSSF